jgi:hypothetical protein
MKTQNEIEKELEKREKKTKFSNYGEKRANSTMIETLRWILNLPSKMRTSL